MKFNLNSYAKKVSDGDKLNEVKLEVERADAPEEITEKQLDRDRIPEKDVTMEKLLDQKRTGGSDKIVEQNLNESKSKLVQHRNTETSTGDINKLEEQRMEARKKANRRAEPASSTPKKMRWWEDLKASSDKQTKTAQALNFNEEDRWERMPGSWSEEEGLSNDTNFQLPQDDFSVEEIGSEPLSVEDIKPVDSPMGKGLYVSFTINPDSQMGSEELQDAAYNKTLSEGYEYLSSVEGFTPASFSVKGDKIVARLFGEEYYPAGKGEVGVDAGLDSNPFSVAEVSNTDVEGIVVGNVTVDPNMLEMVKDMDDEEIRRKVMDVIFKSNEGISVEDDGIDLDQLGTGKVSFVGEVDVARKGRPESYENVRGDALAATDFDIVVLADTKKN